MTWGLVLDLTVNPCLWAFRQKPFLTPQGPAVSYWASPLPAIHILGIFKALFSECVDSFILEKFLIALDNRPRTDLEHTRFKTLNFIFLLCIREYWSSHVQD